VYRNQKEEGGSAGSHVSPLIAAGKKVGVGSQSENPPREGKERDRATQQLNRQWTGGDRLAGLKTK